MLNTINIYVIGKFTYSEQEKRKKKKEKKGTVYNYNKGIRNVLQFLMKSSN